MTRLTLVSWLALNRKSKQNPFSSEYMFFSNEIGNALPGVKETYIAQNIFGQKMIY
jgi:hypothetical protein